MTRKQYWFGVILLCLPNRIKQTLAHDWISFKFNNWKSSQYKRTFIHLDNNPYLPQSKPSSVKLHVSPAHRLPAASAPLWPLIMLGKHTSILKPCLINSLSGESNLKLPNTAWAIAHGWKDDSLDWISEQITCPCWGNPETRIINFTLTTISCDLILGEGVPTRLPNED